MAECNHSHLVVHAVHGPKSENICWAELWASFKRSLKDVIKSQWPSASSILRPLLCLPLCHQAAATASTPFCFFSVAAFLWLHVYCYQAGQAHYWHLFCLGHWSVSFIAPPLLVPLHCYSCYHSAVIAANTSCFLLPVQTSLLIMNAKGRYHEINIYGDDFYWF